MPLSTRLKPTKLFLSSFILLVSVTAGFLQHVTTSKSLQMNAIFAYQSKFISKMQNQMFVDRQEEEDEEDFHLTFIQDDNSEGEEDYSPYDKRQESVGSESDPKRSSSFKNPRWKSLDAQSKNRIIQEAHQRAIRNKQKREPIADKKRRLLMFYKSTEIQRKKDSRVRRLMPTHSPKRTPLSEIVPGTEMNGIVISLTGFGVYVDVGTECDGLLHISQITQSEFISHPKQKFKPGDTVVVRVVRASPELKKLQLTMLPVGSENIEIASKEENEDRIQLEDVAVNDELWGEMKRVTDFGAYVEVGAVVDGFLHFMDHPEFGIVPGAHPSEFMKVGDRIRCWVADVDLEKERIKLTANRPVSLPGPRREYMQ